MPESSFARFTVLVALSWPVAVIMAASPAPPAAPIVTYHEAGTLFSHSDNCVACHNNLVTADGEDASIGAAWRSTMMANSARDPYWQAGVRRETIDHPSKSAEERCCAHGTLLGNLYAPGLAGMKGWTLCASFDLLIYILDRVNICETGSNDARLNLDGVLTRTCPGDVKKAKKK